MIRIILFLLISHLAHSQILVQGKVMDTNNRPIPYVNIGILNSTFGTISNEDGSFAMRIPVSHQFDSVLFSALGYVSKSYAVADALQKSLVVSLAVKLFILMMWRSTQNANQISILNLGIHIPVEEY
jgi:hypothetical protein